MADNEFQVESMGEIYAQALVNEAEKQGVFAEVAEDVRGIGELLQKDESFRAFVQAVTLREEEQMAVLERIFSGRIHSLTLNTMKAMARRGRLMFLRGPVEGLDASQKRMSGMGDVERTSASPISDAVVAKVKAALASGRTGGTPDIKVTIDPSLIGGMRVRIGDTLIDGSVAKQLEKMRDQLKLGRSMKSEAVLS